jgi:hypothetical protein
VEVAVGAGSRVAVSEGIRKVPVVVEGTGVVQVASASLTWDDGGGEATKIAETAWQANRRNAVSTSQRFIMQL